MFPPVYFGQDLENAPPSIAAVTCHLCGYCNELRPVPGTDRFVCEYCAAGRRSPGHLYTVVLEALYLDHESGRSVRLVEATAT